MNTGLQPLFQRSNEYYYNQETLKIEQLVLGVGSMNFLNEEFDKVYVNEL